MEPQGGAAAGDMRLLGGLRSLSPRREVISMTTRHELMDTEVVTRDGEKLGIVKEISDGAFKVSAAMQPDYWLSSDCITSVVGHQAMLAFDKGRLGDHKLDHPPEMAH